MSPSSKDVCLNLSLRGLHCTAEAFGKVNNLPRFAISRNLSGCNRVAHHNTTYLGHLLSSEDN
eukprot:6459663-Amphidinium_carterae.2